MTIEAEVATDTTEIAEIDSVAPPLDAHLQAVRALDVGHSVFELPDLGKLVLWQPLRTAQLLHSRNVDLGKSPR